MSRRWSFDAPEDEKPQQVWHPPKPDRPLPTKLEARAAKLLAEAAVISEASGANLQPRTSQAAPQSREPHIGGESTYDWMLGLFRGCESPRELERAVKRAERELRVVRGQERPSEARLSPKVQAVKWQGVPAGVVARSLCCTPRQVRTWRQQCGLEPEWGWPERDMAA